MAGIATLANQARHRPLGFLNPQLYRLAGSSAFNDITPSGGTLAVLRHRLKPNGKVATHAALARPRQLAGHGAAAGTTSPASARRVRVQLLSALR